MGKNGNYKCEYREVSDINQQANHYNKQSFSTFSKKKEKFLETLTRNPSSNPLKLVNNRFYLTFPEHDNITTSLF